MGIVKYLIIKKCLTFDIIYDIIMVSRGKGNNKDSKPPSLKKCKIPLDKINLLCYNKGTKKKGNKKNECN